MQFWGILYAILISFFSKTQVSIGSEEYMVNLSRTMIRDIYYITRSMPLVGCNVYCLVKPKDIKFYLYSNNETQYGTLVDISNPTAISNKKNTIVLIFGWLGRGEFGWIKDMKRIFITQYNYDVIIVDWSNWSLKDYIVAANAVRCVGFLLGELIANSVQNNGILLEKFKIVGFSLGAQIAGFSGKKFQELTGVKLPLIIALDPAGPCFNPNPSHERISSSDAEVVHVIHCNAYKFGINYACGTLDSWVNGGCLQPGCTEIFVKKPSKLIQDLFCSHSRCPRVLIQALLHPKKLLAQECGSWTGCNTAKIKNNKTLDFGETESFESGEYCLHTTAVEPYFN